MYNKVILIKSVLSGNLRKKAQVIIMNDQIHGPVRAGEELMGASKNIESARREQDGVVYYDRGILEGRDGRRYQRYAIKTHFVQPNEDQAELVRRYVLPLFKEGDCLSFTAKVMGMCTGAVRTLEDTHPGFWAKLLSPFAGHNSTGIGMHQPYKMQLTIELCGLPRVLFAAAVSAVTRPFGIRGLFYKICGHDVAGIDGFYPDSSFEVYHTMGVLNPTNSPALCDALFAETGVPVVVMDANDFDQNQLGKASSFPLTDDQIQDAMADNPSGQGDELTPFILIRPLKD